MPSPSYVPVIPTGRDLVVADVDADAIEADSIALSGPENSTVVFETYVEGEAFARTSLNAGGGYDFGPGTGPSDTNLYRNGAGVLRTDSDLQVGGDLAVTGSSLGEPHPANHGIIAWSSDPTNSVNNSVLTNGTVYLSAVYPAANATVTKLYFHMTTSAVTPTAGQNWIALYDATGTRMATTNIDASLSGAGLKGITITGQPVTAGGLYWVALLVNAGTAPSVGRSSGQAGIGEAINIGLTAATFRYATNGTLQTSLPATITPTANQVTTFAGPWVAIGA